MAGKPTIFGNSINLGNENLTTYDEGTWTPTVTGSSTAGTASYTHQTGYYTKIGRMVTVNGRVAYSGHTGTGNLTITGLPFTSANTSNNFFFGMADLYNVTLTVGNSSYIGIGANSAVINCYQMPTGGGASTNVGMDAAADIAFSLTYMS